TGSAPLTTSSRRPKRRARHSPCEMRWRCTTRRLPLPIIWAPRCPRPRGWPYTRRRRTRPLPSVSTTWPAPRASDGSPPPTGAGDREAVAAALALTSFVTMWAQDFPAAERYAERAIEVGEAAGAEAAVAGGYLTIGYVRSLSGRHEEGETKFEQALTRSRHAGDVSREVLTLQMVGIFDGWHGDYERGRRAADEALRLARDRGLFVLYMRGLWTRGMVLTSLGGWDDALQNLGEGVALAEKIGDFAFLPRLMNTLGWLHLECGDIEEGRNLTMRALEH